MSLFPRHMPLGAAKRLRSTQAAKAGSADEKRLREACAAGADDALALLATAREGLKPEEAAERLRQYGPNSLSGEKRRGLLPHLPFMLLFFKNIQSK